MTSETPWTVENQLSIFINYSYITLTKEPQHNLIYHCIHNTFQTYSIYIQANQNASHHTIEYINHNNNHIWSCEKWLWVWATVMNSCEIGQHCWIVSQCPNRSNELNSITYNLATTELLTTTIYIHKQFLTTIIHLLYLSILQHNTVPIHRTSCSKLNYIIRNYHFVHLKKK